jgi:cell wall-associated NlpC family hydrolase
LPQDLTRPDPRFLLARPHFAAQALEGIVRAREYRAAEAAWASVSVSDVRDEDGNRISQLLFGEAFDVLERDGDRAWGACRRDGVVGWIAASALTAGVRAPTHRVASIGGALPLNAMVDASRDTVGDVALMPIGEFAPDLVSVAESLLGVAHAPGARSDRETDCAGLVQTCLIACGRAAPRWSDGQAELGHGVSPADLARGDLIIWPHSEGGPGWSGHSALALDAARLIHASGRAGAVVIESVADVDARQRAEGFGAPVFRRIP